MFVFLLGRPGCGKSEVFKRIKETLLPKKLANEIIRVDDFPKLWAIFKEDEATGAWRRCKKTPDGGYLVTDDSVWDEILMEVNKDLLKIDSPDKIIFVEFSRPNYLKALKNFSENILKKSVIIYIYASFETCWKRNVLRHKRALAEGTDDHLVSREEMEKTYLYDDMDELLKLSSIPVFYMSTEWEGEGRLSEVCLEAAKFIEENFRKITKN